MVATFKSTVVEQLRHGGDIAKTKKIANRTGLSGALVGRALSDLKAEGIVKLIGNRKWEVDHTKLNSAYPEVML